MLPKLSKYSAGLSFFNSIVFLTLLSLLLFIKNYYFDYKNIKNLKIRLIII